MGRTLRAAGRALAFRAVRPIFSFAVLLLGARPAHAEEAEVPSPHRVIGAAAAGTVMTTRSDYGERYPHALVLRALYAYRANQHFEVGGGGSVFNVDDVGTIFAPHVSLRLNTTSSPQADHTEFGFSLHAGVTLARYFDATWTGPFVALGPDVRVPLTQTIGMQVGGEIATVGGSTSTTPFDRDLHHLPGFAAQLWIGLLVAP